MGTWPATYILHHVGNIPTAFSGDPVKQLSFTACPESHQIWAIPDWEETDSCAWEPLEDPLPAALSPLMRRSQLVGPYWLQMWHFGRRRGWTCRQTSARLPVTALPPPSPGLWCLLRGVLLQGHQGLSPPSAPGSRWCKGRALPCVKPLLTRRQKRGQKLERERSQPALQTQMAENWWGHCFCITVRPGDSSPQSLGYSLFMTNVLHLCSSQRLAINSAVTSGGFSPHVVITSGSSKCWLWWWHWAAELGKGSTQSFTPPKHLCCSWHHWVPIMRKHSCLCQTSWGVQKGRNKSDKRRFFLPRDLPHLL